MDTDGGCLFLKIPVNRFWFKDVLVFAEKIFALVAHEWKHIADLQKEKEFGSYRRRWKNRPHERRAIVAENKAMRAKDKRMDIQDAIIDLAINIERVRESN